MFLCVLVLDHVCWLGPLVEAPGAPRVAAMQTRIKEPMIIIAFAIFWPDWANTLPLLSYHCNWSVNAKGTTWLDHLYSHEDINYYDSQLIYCISTINMFSSTTSCRGKVSVTVDGISTGYALQVVAAVAHIGGAETIIWDAGWFCG